MIRRTVRTGFTLLEVLLAMSIGLLLLGALYVVVDTQLKHAQASREIVEQSTLARAILTRMDHDIAHSITLSDPGRFRNAQSAANTSSSTSGSGTGSGTTGTAGTTGTSASGATTTGSSLAGGTSTSSTNTIALPLSLIGDNQTLHIFVTRIPRDAVNAARGSDLPPASSDTRRISYWFVGDGNGGPNSGLAKQEVQPVSSDDALQNIPPGVDDGTYKLIGPEVRSLNLTYFDGTNWNDTWDSTVIGADGVTPIGPPLAVSIEIELPGIGGPDVPTKHYRHVVWIMTANGTTVFQPQTTTGGGTTSP